MSQILSTEGALHGFLFTAGKGRAEFASMRQRAMGSIVFGLYLLDVSRECSL